MRLHYKLFRILCLPPSNYEQRYQRGDRADDRAKREGERRACQMSHGASFEAAKGNHCAEDE